MFFYVVSVVREQRSKPNPTMCDSLSRRHQGTAQSEAQRECDINAMRHAISNANQRHELCLTDAQTCCTSQASHDLKAMLAPPICILGFLTRPLGVGVGGRG